MSTPLLHLGCAALLLPPLFLAPAPSPAQEGARDPFAEPPGLAGARPFGSATDGDRPILRGLAERADGRALALVESARGEVLLLGRGDALNLGGSPFEVRAISAAGVHLVPLAGGREVHLR